MEQKYKEPIVALYRVGRGPHAGSRRDARLAAHPVSNAAMSLCTLSSSAAISARCFCAVSSICLNRFCGGGER
jgi:hypothetical protein